MVTADILGPFGVQIYIRVSSGFRTFRFHSGEILPVVREKKKFMKVVQERRKIHKLVTEGRAKLAEAGHGKAVAILHKPVMRVTPFIVRDPTIIVKVVKTVFKHWKRNVTAGRRDGGIGDPNNSWHTRKGSMRAIIFWIISIYEHISVKK